MSGTKAFGYTEKLPKAGQDAVSLLSLSSDFRLRTWKNLE
jgi:hypothetical protein